MSAKWTFWAWEQPIKQAPKKLALLQLANNANDDGKSWYSIVKMAKSCGVSERTFQRSIQELEKANILHVERRSNRPSIYTLAEAIEVVLHGGDSVSGCQSDGAGCQSVTSRGVTVSPDLNNDPNTTPNNIINKGIEDEFNYFWANGLNNGSKKKALESFTKIIKKSKECPKEFSGKLVLDCIARKKANHFGFENLHATTYLNQERWTDKIQVSQPVQPKYAAKPDKSQMYEQTMNIEDF